MEDNTNEEQIKMPDIKGRSQRLMKTIEEIEQRRKVSRRKIRKLKIITICLFIFGFLITFLPAYFGKKLTCKEMDTAPFYEKWHYYTHPLIIHPCDTNSPFLNK